MPNSGFNQGQTGNASEVGAGIVKLATQLQVDNKDPDDGGIPLVVTPDKIPSSSTLIHARAYTNISGQSLTAGVVIPLELENFDTNDFHDNVTNNSRLTIPVGLAGVYLIGAQVRLGNANPGVIAIRLNGTTFIAMAGMRGYSTNIAGNSATTIYTLAEGDYVEMWGQNSNTVVGDEATALWLTKLA